MNDNAGFMKRSFAALIDLAVVILVAWLLFLFPFKMIIGNSVHKDYKKVFIEPYEQISEKYSGTTTFLGTTTIGIYSVINGSADEESKSFKVEGSSVLNFREYVDTANSSAKLHANALLNSAKATYNPETKMEEQFTSRLYAVYMRLSNIYLVETEYKESSDGRYFDDMLAAGEINKDEYDALVKAYLDDLEKEYISNLEILLKTATLFQKNNPDVNITQLLGYKNLYNEYVSLSKKKVSDLSSDVTDEDITKIVNKIDSYYAKEQKVFRMDESINQDETYVYGIDAYYVVYYDAIYNQTIEQLPYTDYYNSYSTWTVIYALGMFTLLFTIYTMSFRGYTLGRRLSKIYLISGSSKERCNPILAFLHDVVFRYLYILVIGMWSLIAALVVFIVFVIADAIMMKVGKRKTIRDMITMTRVINA